MTSNASERISRPWSPPGLWNADFVLGLWNPSCNDYTCLGIAAPHDIRCAEYPAAPQRASARNIIRRLKIERPEVVARSHRADLRRLAELWLCRDCTRDRERNVERVVETWARVLSIVRTRNIMQRWTQRQQRYTQLLNPAPLAISDSPAISSPSAIAMAPIGPVGPMIPASSASSDPLARPVASTSAMAPGVPTPSSNHIRSEATAIAGVEQGADQGLQRIEVFTSESQLLPGPQISETPDPPFLPRTGPIEPPVAQPPAVFQYAPTGPLAPIRERLRTPQLDPAEEQRINSHFAFLVNTQEQLQRRRGVDLLQWSLYQPQSTRWLRAWAAEVSFLENQAHDHEYVIREGTRHLLTANIGEFLTAMAEGEGPLYATSQLMMRSRSALSSDIARLDAIRQHLMPFPQGPEARNGNIALPDMPGSRVPSRPEIFQVVTPSDFQLTHENVSRRNDSLPASSFDHESSVWTEASTGEFPAFCVRHVPRREIDEDCCSICLEEWGDTRTVWCRAQCGENFHWGCMETWKKFGIAKDGRATCPKWCTWCPCDDWNRF